MFVMSELTSPWFISFVKVRVWVCNQRFSFSWISVLADRNQVGSVISKHYPHPDV